MRNQTIEGAHDYVFLDVIVLKKTWADEVRNVSISVPFGVNEAGVRETLGTREGPNENKAGWGEFSQHLRDRGLKAVKLFVSDKCMGLVESPERLYPEAL